MYVSSSSKARSANIISGCQEHIIDLISRGYVCYMFTHTFNDTEYQQSRTYQSSTVLRNYTPSDLWKGYDRFHRHMSSKIVGNSWARKRWLQPIVYAFIDVSGTRYNKPGVIRNVVPGIHAIWCIHPRVQTRFDKKATYSTAGETLYTHRDLRVRHITHRPRYVTSYCAKFLRWDLDNVADDHFWNVFPRAKSECGSPPHSR